MRAHSGASCDAPGRSYDLSARYLFPRLQGQYGSTMGASARARASRPALAEVHAKAVEAATQKYHEEAAKRGG